jgi:hypothetical protein
MNEEMYRAARFVGFLVGKLSVNLANLTRLLLVT